MGSTKVIGGDWINFRGNCRQKTRVMRVVCVGIGVISYRSRSIRVVSPFSSTTSNTVAVP